MTFTPEFTLQLLATAGAIFASYAAIRSDLAALHERTATAIKAAELAHSRIDAILQEAHK